MSFAEGHKEKTCSAPKLLLRSVGGAGSRMDLRNCARKVVLGENFDSHQMGLQQIRGEVRRASQLGAAGANTLQHLRLRLSPHRVASMPSPPAPHTYWDSGKGQGIEQLPANLASPPCPLTLHFQVHGLRVLADGVAGGAHVLARVRVLDLLEGQRGHARVAAHDDPPVQGLHERGTRSELEPRALGAAQRDGTNSTSRQPRGTGGIASPEAR